MEPHSLRDAVAQSSTRVVQEPKSQSLQTPLSVSRTFSSLRSLLGLGKGTGTFSSLRSLLGLGKGTGTFLSLGSLLRLG